MGSGTAGRSALELADRILKRAGHKLPQLQAEELLHRGDGAAKASRIVAAFELARRFFGRERPVVSEPKDGWSP